jgi:hypothetical protein
LIWILLEVVANTYSGGHDTVMRVETVRVYAWTRANLMLEVFWDAGAVDVENCVERLCETEGVNDTK